MKGAPLRGIRVVDLTTTFMGPFCTMQMARMGADVIKVEDPTGGDVARGILDTDGIGLGPVFLAANHGKRGLALDLKSQEGRTAFLALIATADVVVTNMRPAALDRLGLSAAEIHEANPSCIYAQLVGFASGGPYSGLAAYDDVIQAVSGLASVQGGGGDPVYVKSAVADKISGMYALSAILAALHERSQSGEGSTLEVPMFEAMAAFNLLDHQGGLVYDPPRGPSGYSRHASPHRKPYRTADGFLSVVVYTDRMWLSFFDLIGRPELAEEPRYKTITGRTQHIDELYQLVEEELATQPSAYWLTALADAGIPVIPVNTLDDLFADDHLIATGFFEEIEHPAAGTLKLPKHPVTFGGPAPHTPGAPLLGEHTIEILSELGIAKEEI